MGNQAERRNHSRQGVAGKSKPKEKKNYGSFQFINITPTKGDESQAKQAYEAGELALGAEYGWVENGFDFKCSWDKNNACFKAQFTDMRDDSKTYNHAFSMRGSTPTAATLKALFFMEFRYEQVWEQQVSSEKVNEDWF